MTLPARAEAAPIGEFWGHDPNSARIRYRVPGIRVPRILLREERLQISVENEFCTPLGRAVGIMAAHWIVSPVAPDPFPVFIAFVAGDVDQDFDAGVLRTASNTLTVPPTFVSKVNFGSS